MRGGCLCLDVVDWLKQKWDVIVLCGYSSPTVMLAIAYLEAGWTECQISVSNSLDEYIIQDILRQGAKIDLFGVGERLITAKSEPVFGGVYKLVAVENPDGTVQPKIKISENVGKITTPHYKKMYRFIGNDTGKAIADYLCVYDETVDDSHDMEIFDPDATWKRKPPRALRYPWC